jgi:hypothetical protein
MRIAVALFLLLAGCPTAPPKDASLRDAHFQTICQSSSECTHNSNGCNYCYQGACSCSLPAEPTLPIDGGVDAPGSTTQ